MNSKWCFVDGDWQETDLGAEKEIVPEVARGEDVRESRAVQVGDAERRTDPRLRLCYPIEIRSVVVGKPTVLQRTVTQDLSARGAYFCIEADPTGADPTDDDPTGEHPTCEVGLPVVVVVRVPHRLASSGASDGRDVSLDLRGDGRIVRMDSPARGSAGENGVRLTGIAVEFSRPLDFSYAWV